MSEAYDNSVNNDVLASSSNIGSSIKAINDVNQNYYHNMQKSVENTSKNKTRRPAKPLYVPRALRTQNDSSKNCIKSLSQNDAKCSNLKETNILQPTVKEKQPLDILNLKKQSLNTKLRCTDITYEQDFFDRESKATKSNEIVTNLDFKDFEHGRINLFAKSSDIQLNKNLHHDEAKDISLCKNSEFLDIYQIPQIHGNEVCSDKKEIACNIEEGFSMKMPCGPAKIVSCINQNESSDIPAECLSDVDDAKVPDSTGIMNGTWDTIYNDEFLKPCTAKQLQAVIGNAKIIHPKTDYKQFKCEDKVTEDDYSSVIELYDFPAEFKTHDLLAALLSFKSENFVIKWVDDNHAISMFSSPFIAYQALELKHPFIKVRPVSQGLPESKLKARKLMKERYFRTSMPRPATSAVLAKRLVSGALGVKANISREEREREKQLVKEARGQKQKDKKHKEDIWNGDVS